MAAMLQLYRDGDLEKPETMPLAPVLRAGVAQILGRALRDSERVRFLLALATTADRYDGMPSLANMLPEYGYGDVYIYDHDRLVYRHPHTVEEVIGPPLRKALRHIHPEVREWWFFIEGSGLPRPSSRPTPVVQHSFAPSPINDGENFAFTIREAPAPVLAEAQLSDFGAPRLLRGSGYRAVSVLVDDNVARDFLGDMRFSDAYEEGGFLLGHVFRDREQDDGYIVHIVDAPKAHHTGASLLHFTFTGDSFREVKQDLGAGGHTSRIVGWYHTHLFEATDDLGLSSIDLVLHTQTFRQPWQLAGLINVIDGQRTLRFYGRTGATFFECPCWNLPARQDGLIR